MTTTVSGLVDNVTQLVSFPDVALQINDKLSTDCDIEDIGAIIEPDPALSAALLRLANSAMYNVGGTVENINKALMLVGLREVRDIAFGICTTATFKGIPNELITVHDFWKHSLHCASAARFLASAANVRTVASAFTSGLLHDIGQLVMFHQCPEQSRAALELSLDQSDGQTPHLSEREVFGFDHTEVGAALAESWQFPASLSAAIRGHHSPFDNADAPDSVILIHAANSIAVLAELDSNNLSDAPPIDPRAVDMLSLTPERIAEATRVTRESVDELLQLFVN